MSLMQRGFTRLLHEGRQIDLASPDDYQREDFENVFALVDRLTARKDLRQRLVDSLETCFREGHGRAVIQVSEPPREITTRAEGSGKNLSHGVAGGQIKLRNIPMPRDSGPTICSISPQI